MTAYPIHIGYDTFLRTAVGTLSIECELDAQQLASTAIVPAVKHDKDGKNLEVSYWAIVPRTTVDTRPEPFLGETTPLPEITDEMVERLAVYLLNAYRAKALVEPATSLDHLSEFGRKDWRDKARAELEVALKG